jgi:AcrR family transcriptional regulator
VVAGEDTYDPGDGSVQARAGVVARLRARHGELVGEIFARVSGDAFAPPGGSGSSGVQDAEYVAGLRATVAATVEYALQGIERGEGWAGPIPAVASEQARRAARAGVNLDTVLRRYVLGSALLGECVMEEADREQESWTQPTQRGALREALRAQAAALDRLIAEVSRAYGEALAGAAQTVPPGGDRASRRQRISRKDSTSRKDSASRRDRITEAMAELAAERGFEHVTVRLVAQRAGVSTRTFYEEFGDLRECFLAVLDLALVRAGELIAQAFMREERWQDGLLRAMASLLLFLESEPLLARVWFVEAMAAGSWALQRREQIAEALRSMVIEYWAVRGEDRPEPVAMAGVMAAVLGLVQTHLVTGRPGPLIELLGPLMGLVTSLRLEKQEVAREVQRGVQLAREIQQGRASPIQSSGAKPPAGASADVTAIVPAALLHPRAHRLRLGLQYVVEQAARGHAPSNREVGAAIGVAHRGQVFKLLSKLAALGLLANRPGARGYPNAWSATPAGEQVARALVRHVDPSHIRPGHGH